MRAISLQSVMFLFAGALFGIVFRTVGLSFFGDEFYLGNFLIYLLGSFFIGFIFNETRNIFNPDVKMCLIMAMLGMMATLSGILMDFPNFMQVGEFRGAFLYFLITNLLAIGGYFLGYQVSTDNE